MKRSFMCIAVKGMNKRTKARIKAVKCMFCNNETYQDDHICVLCRNYITRTHEELISLLVMDKRKRHKEIRSQGE
jgi:hypothetical protein